SMIMFSMPNPAAAQQPDTRCNNLQSTICNLQLLLASRALAQGDQPAGADLFQALGHAPIAENEGLHRRVRQRQRHQRGCGHYAGEWRGAAQQLELAKELLGTKLSDWADLGRLGALGLAARQYGRAPLFDDVEDS